jgi:hypothetical protein
VAQFSSYYNSLSIPTWQRNSGLIGKLMCALAVDDVNWRKERKTQLRTQLYRLAIATLCMSLFLSLSLLARPNCTCFRFRIRSLKPWLRQRSIDLTDRHSSLNSFPLPNSISPLDSMRIVFLNAQELCCRDS